MIKADHISKSFDGRVVLDDVSVEFDTGTTNLVIGKSGSGKTVLLKCLVGLHEVDSGSIWYDDIDFTALGFKERKAIRRDIGMLFQGGALLDSSTVEENVKLPLDLFTSQSEKEKMERVDFCLQRVRLEDANHLYPAELSGGMIKRVAIARALVTGPSIICMDEPLSNLDAKLRVQLRNELKKMQREFGITTIYVTHDQEEALTMSDTIVVMNQGYIQQIGTPEDIYNEPKNAFVADFIGDSNIVDGVMHRDFLVSFSGVEFPCVDRGFAREQSVQVVVRPEDIEVVSPMEGQLVGVVNDVIFKGVHFEMHVECEGREWLIHSTRACTPGETIGMKIGPNEIHIMARS